MKYIISGTGRSGTTLIHSVLKKLEVGIGQHERSLGSQGGVGGYRVMSRMIGNSKDVNIITQIREPLQTINSILKSSPSDFPDLGLYKRDFSNIHLYTLNVWYEIHLKLMENSILNYTLNNLNNGEVTDKLISLFNIKCSPNDFDTHIKQSLNTSARNKRGGGPNLSLNDLKNLNPSLFNKVYELYNNVENAHKKT